MKILSVDELRSLDQYTISNEPIRSDLLMERAGTLCFEQLIELISSDQEVIVFCGSGNNGGDGFVIARLFINSGYKVKTFFVSFGEMSEDCKLNFLKIKNEVSNWNTESQFNIHNNCVIIDALLGIGAGKTPEGTLKNAIEWINNSGQPVYAIDMPSGLSPDTLPSHSVIVQSTSTFTFHSPKTTFFLPETAQFVGKWLVIDIGLNKEESNRYNAEHFWLNPDEPGLYLPLRERFTHKGNYGHGLLIAGSNGKMGAVILAAKGALRSGLGLLTVYTTALGKTILPIAIPEAMGIFDQQEDTISNLNLGGVKIDAIAIGPGLGQPFSFAEILNKVLAMKIPTVIDADALNLMAQHPDILKNLHHNCILTPHPKEFDRLVGKWQNSMERLKLLKVFVQKHQCTVVLKDAVSTIATPNGMVYFNTTGNPGMAKAGSGDTLTGIILGLITQGILTETATQIAVFQHGRAGDALVKEKGEQGLLASDISEFVRFSR